eukprot:scaffold46479_cov69-Phaeocystis_antarctica.AAC.2
MAAAISSVVPLLSPQRASRASTPPPPSSHAVTACALPSPDEFSTLVGSPSSAAAGSGALADGAGSAGSAATVEGAALAFFVFLALALLGRCLLLRGLLRQQLRCCRRRPGLRLSRLPLGVLPKQLRCRCVLLLLGKRERRAAAASGLQRGVGLGVEQRLHDRGAAIASSTHQSGAAEGVLQVDARTALQQHPHHRLLPS